MLSRRTAVSLVAVALSGVLAAGCSGGGGSAASAPSTTSASPPASPSLPSTHTVTKPRVTRTAAPVHTLAPVALQRQSVPLRITVEQVSGAYPKKARGKHLRQWVAKPVQMWIQGAFLTGGYPRSKFPKAFRRWTPDAAHLAKKDKKQTTNVALGRRLRTLVADQQRVRLYLFAHDNHSGGATAQVQLRLTGETRDGTVVHYAVRGQLYLTRQGSHWYVFGYDLTQTKAGKKR